MVNVDEMPFVEFLKIVGVEPKRSNRREWKTFV